MSDLIQRPPVDPSFVKLWRVWVNWFDNLPFWDPYGAAVTLLLTGLVSGYLLWRMIDES